MSQSLLVWRVFWLLFWSFIVTKAYAARLKLHQKMSLSKHAQHLSWQPEKHKWTNSCLLFLLIFTLILPFILFIPTHPLVICLLCSFSKICFCAGLFCPSLLHRYPSPHLSLSLSLFIIWWMICVWEDILAVIDRHGLLNVKGLIKRARPLPTLSIL